MTTCACARVSCTVGRRAKQPLLHLLILLLPLLLLCDFGCSCVRRRFCPLHPALSTITITIIIPIIIIPIIITATAMTSCTQVATPLRRLW